MKKQPLFILMILMLLIPGYLSAEVTSREVHIAGYDRIIIGYWEEWRHSDGITWQDTDHDGDFPHHPPQEEEAELKADIPAEIQEKYDKVRVVYIPFQPVLDRNGIPIKDSNIYNYNKALFERAYFSYEGKDGKLYKYAGDLAENEYIECGGNDYFTFYRKVISYIPPEYSLISGNKVKLISDGNKYKVKKEWQNKEVRGWRFMLPALVEYYGTPKAVETSPSKGYDNAKSGEPIPPQSPESLPCQNKPSITCTWEELYTWEVTHSSSSVDPITGKVTYDSWTETKWATPTYSETLTANLSVNTKQGIPTDPDNPKESDRESRGSWEIIPDCNSPSPKYRDHDIRIYGINPNEVTRAGYGFEVTLETTYKNDWETKVPAGASPHGGTFHGPTKAVVQFYNTKGFLVKEVNLVPIQGNAGGKSISWELPDINHTYPDGETITERKHYTDVKNPDGVYLVRVIVSGAGKTDMCLIRDKYVYIYGCMWDDIYTRIDK